MAYERRLVPKAEYDALESKAFEAHDGDDDDGPDPDSDWDSRCDRDDYAHDY